MKSGMERMSMRSSQGVTGLDGCTAGDFEKWMYIQNIAYAVTRLAFAWDYVVFNEEQLSAAERAAVQYGRDTVAQRHDADGFYCKPWQQHIATGDSYLSSDSGGCYRSDWIEARSAWHSMVWMPMADGYPSPDIGAFTEVDGVQMPGVGIGLAYKQLLLQRLRTREPRVGDATNTGAGPDRAWGVGKPRPPRSLVPA